MGGRRLVWIVAFVVLLCCAWAPAALADGKLVVETPSGLKWIETSVQRANAKFVSSAPLVIQVGGHVYECGFEITGPITYHGENFKSHRQMIVGAQLAPSDCESDIGPSTLATDFGTPRMNVYTNGSSNLSGRRNGAPRTQSLFEITTGGVTCTYRKGRFHMTFPQVDETPVLLSGTAGKLALETSVANPPSCAKKGTIETGPLAFYAETPTTGGFFPVVLTQKTGSEISL
jgi:hypothetical protein